MLGTAKRLVLRSRHAFVVAAFGALALAHFACGGPQGDVCAPTTIQVNDTCHWTKEPACDAAGCLPPNECVIIEEQPARVECRKPE